MKWFACGRWDVTRSISVSSLWRRTQPRTLSSRAATSAANATGSGDVHPNARELIEQASERELGVASTVGSSPDHLLLLVHGLVGTVRDWNYIRDQFSARLGRHFLVYASAANEGARTFQGVDRAGERLADEVRALVSGKPSLKHISFLGHSMGGLIARYAVALLYEEGEAKRGHEQGNEHQPGDRDEASRKQSPAIEGGNRGSRGKIAGLDAACFITLATPHLGVRGRGQLPFLLGFDLLERIAVPVAPLVVGRTGKQLFLADGKPSAGNMPLLLRMAQAPSSPADPAFLAALGAFHTRVAYANAGFDHMVGWQTSSIRRHSELPQIPRHPISSVYKHVMLVQDCPAVAMRASKGAVSKGAAASLDEQGRGARGGQGTVTLDLNALQEQMVCGLQTLAWRKVDVSFRNGLFPFFAHNSIHVKLQWLHFDGAGVVHHLTDTMKELETQYLQSRL